MPPYNEKAEDNLEYSSLKAQFLAFILPEQNETQMSFVLLRLALWIGVVLYSLTLLGSIDYNKGTLIHLTHLPFHEAGHVIFGLLGNQFIGSLGGMLGQLIMPLICAGTLLIQQRDAFGASLSMWWFAQSFVDLAPYIKDASIGEMPLIGGNTGKTSPYGFHDFEYLLTETGLIAHDHSIAMLFHLLGWLLMVLFLSWGAIILWRQYQSCLNERM